jgi:hypothetical protein
MAGGTQGDEVTPLAPRGVMAETYLPVWDLGDDDIIHNFPPIHGKCDSLRHDAGIIVENGGDHENQRQKLV